MSLGLMGKKCGMTRVFTEAGKQIPVTVIQVLPNRITQIKTADTDGYSAVQITAGNKKASHVNKSLAGHFAKANVEAGSIIKEFRLAEKELSELSVGATLTLEIFKVGQYVDVQGVTKGAGFAGVVKRHHFRTQDATHGNSLSHRAPGSIGQRQTPGRVMKGKRMAGHLGNVQRTAINQEVIKIDLERHLLLVKGAIPGAEEGVLVITPSVKTKGEH